MPRNASHDRKYALVRDTFFSQSIDELFALGSPSRPLAPFAGMRVTGWPVATVVRGQVVMRDDEVLGTPRGRLVRFAG